METYLYHVKGNDYSRIHEGDEHVPKKRPKLNPVPIQMQSENFEILEVSSLIAENFKSEKLEDELEEIVPFEQTIISKAVEAESPNSIMQNPKIPLNGLRMNFNNTIELESHDHNFHGISELYENKQEECARGRRLNKRNVADIKCGICDWTFENRFIYDTHMISVHMKNPYNCLICPDVSFPTHRELKKHQAKLHHEKMVKDVKTELSCGMPGCAYVTKDRRHLWRHKKIHSTERPWKCDECDYTCKYKDSLIIHQEMVYSNLTTL